MEAGKIAEKPQKLLLQGKATRVAIENPLSRMDGSDQAS